MTTPITPETILIFSANGEGEESLSIDHEIRDIQNALRGSRKRFVIQYIPAVRPEDLRRALLDYSPAYVHFAGHGMGEDGLLLDQGSFATADALAEQFRLFKSIRCVVLNACHSTVQAEAIVKHIDYVVGMNTEIGDPAAIVFAAAFYDALGADEPIDFAFELGRNAIQMAGLQEHLTPELFTRLERVAPTSQHARRRSDWDGAPTVDHLYGRDVPAQQLSKWILEDSCRVVLVTGLGGIGKTDLVMAVGRGGVENAESSTLSAGIEDHFDRVLWRSLLNAPPPTELFDDILGILSDHREGATTQPQRQFDEFLACLQARRCLIVLDNVESILSPGDLSRRYLDGYERYGEFFELVAKTDHHSCLVLTSREKPRVIAELEGARRRVRSLALTGIKPVEVRKLFETIGTFRGSAGEWNDIATLYGGNPLALELAARHVAEVFDGDLHAFLNRDRRLFEDMEALLDWHLLRLSPAERELIDWLAIEREPVTVGTLVGDVVPRRMSDRVASTLQTVQRRIPLERAPQFFSLQPVLIEHLTAKLVDRISSVFLDAVRSRDSGSALALFRELNTHTLAKATAREHIRETQLRLIVSPIAEQLTQAVGARELRAFLTYLLDAWRCNAFSEPGYAVGNLIHILSWLQVDLSGMNFSGLHVWQASLHAVNLHATDFTLCDFRHTTFRHAFGTVFSVAYSTDGQLIAVGDDNGAVSRFFAASGQLQMSRAGHGDVLFAIQFSPDGMTMASGGYDNTIRLWNTNDGHCKDVFLGHDGWILSLAFSPDGKSLASASEDGTCRIWDLASGQHVVLLTEEPSFLAAVAYSPDGALLATAGSSGTLYLFPTDDLEHPTRVSVHNTRIRSLAFSRQGDLLASGSEDQQVILWRPSDGQKIASLAGHTGTVMSLSFSASGHILASASFDHTVRLWSTSRQECIGELYASPARVWAVDCSPNGGTLVTASEDSAVRVWDIDSRKLLTTLRGYSNKTWSLAWHPGQRLLATGSEDGAVRVWDVQDAKATLELRGHETRVWSVAFSSDGRWVASGSDDLTVRLWDLQSGRCRQILRSHTDWIRSVAFDPRSQFIASGAEDGAVCLWDLETGSLLVSIDSGMLRVVSVAFCENGKTIAVGGSENGINLLSVADGSMLERLGGHNGWLTFVASDGDHLLASCGEDGTITIWDLTSRKCVQRFSMGRKAWGGAFVEGGLSFVAGHDDGTLRKWNVRTGGCDVEVRAHQGWIWSLAVTGDEDIVATTGDDGVIRLWRLSDFQAAPFPDALRSPRPYESMNVTGATGLSLQQLNALTALGAIEMPTR